MVELLHTIFLYGKMTQSGVLVDGSDPRRNTYFLTVATFLETHKKSSRVAQYYCWNCSYTYRNWCSDWNSYDFDWWHMSFYLNLSCL